ncbi:hypothetical protein [Phytomonospora endophytica]|uniref:Uncharacterized protein n=1 Tax=Phytomonospora endophytica TaxID=714109 RepID=A0A841F716_9ACTN|nr:hypothetical protein [Phytomonospora endophytica]MBB6032781.1 hypothetical protein [Phytomonospora endophytica]GIG66070.1 hypothetical protein Pen01_23650 [Phytomonospora endophytica]
MGRRSLLRRVDDLLLPPIGRGIRWLQAGTGRRRVVTSTALIACALLVVAAVWSTDRPTQHVDDSGPVVHVGVNEGESIPDYAADSHGELVLLAKNSTAPTWALVSFAAYVGPEKVTEVAEGQAVARVYARVPMPRAPTEIVQLNVTDLPGGLLDEMDRVADRKDADAAGYADLAGKLSGASEQEMRQREVYRTAQELAEAEADAYRAHCECAYALVVRSTPQELLELSDRGVVRAVDAAPEMEGFERAVFLPALPEQPGIAGPPGSALSDDEPPVGSPPASEPVG